MNVLLISPLSPPAGGIASWTKRYQESKKDEENNIYVVNTAIIRRAKELHKRSYYDELRRTIRIILNLYKQLNENIIDVVHLNSSCGKLGLIRDYLCATVVKKYKVKLITHFHRDVSYMVRGKADLFLFKRLVKITDIILTLNEDSKKFTYLNGNKKSINIPNFLTDDYYNSIPIHRKINDRIHSVLFVGHINETKGCNEIYETAKCLPEIQFILIGHINEQFKRMTKPNNVDLLGEVSNDQVKAEMLTADLLLLPTHTEGFPFVVIEAMACGMPIISTPVGAIPDIIENKGGMLVPVKNVEAIAEAILVLQNKKLREEMSCWNRQKVKECYTAEIVMNRLFEIYKGLTIS